MTKMMTIFIKNNELQEFRQIIKDNKIRHGPFRRHYSHAGSGQFYEGYQIDILDPGPTETYFRLKYAEIANY